MKRAGFFPTAPLRGMRSRNLAAFAFGAAVLGLAAPSVAAQETAWAPFDGGQAWETALAPISPDGSGSASARMIPREGKTGPGTLEASFTIIKSAEARYFRDISPAEDWSRVDGVAVDFTNTCADRLMISFFLETGPGGLLQTSPLQSIVGGSSGRLFFDLRNASLRSAETDGKAVSDLRYAGSVRRVGFAVTGLEEPRGKVLFGNMRLIMGPARPGAASAQTAAAASAARSSLSFLSIKENRVDPPVYGLFEIETVLSAEARNPYDPDEIAVDAELVSPSGKTLAVPGFWYVPYARVKVGAYDTVRPAGAGSWRVRFAPTEAGTWRYRLSARAAGGSAVKSPERSFKAVAVAAAARGTARGYVRVSARDSRYFEYEKGGTFFPIGCNVAWYDNRGLAAYDTWFSRMGAEGANYARVWFASWGFGQEWSDSGLGDYGARQRQAWELDYVVNLAEKEGIYLLLNLIYHGPFSIGANPEWSSNPYNKAAGGFLDDPVQFLSDPRAKKLFLQRMRYITARWGYSTHIFAWELWNEANLASGVNASPEWVPWLTGMSAAIRKMDLGRHLVSNSYSSPVAASDPSWAPMDFVQEHKYQMSDWASYIKRETDQAREDGRKPFFMGEYGMTGDIPDSHGIILHDGLWASFMSGASATAMTWWWDQYIEARNLWGHFGPLARFLQGEDPAGAGLAPAPLEKAPGVRIYRIGGPDRIYAWIKDSRYTYRGFEDLAIELGLDKVVFPEVEGFQWKVPAAAGRWSVQLWDPQTGRILSERTLAASGGFLTLEIPAFTKDVAVKIKRQGAEP